MKDFFKQFRDNLENRPEPDFEERDWKALERRLDVQGGRRAAGFAWWWFAAPLALLLLGSNAWFFAKWQAANEKTSSLESEQDTVYITQVIYKTDTVFQTRVIRETRGGNPSASFANNFAHFTSHRDFEFSTPEISIFSNRGGNGISYSANKGSVRDFRNLHPDNYRDGNLLPINNNSEISQTYAGNQVSEIQPIAYNLENLQMPDLQLIKYKNSGLHGLNNLPFPKKEKRTALQLLYAMRPKEFHLGFGSGPAYPFGKNVDWMPGGSANVQTQVAFSPNLRLWLDAGYFKTTFETDKMDPAIGVPEVSPPSDEYVFVKAEVPQPFLQYSAGMQWLFNANNKWKPFVGAGLGTVSLLRHEVIYEFKNGISGIEWDADMDIDRSELLSGIILLHAGLECEFSKHWNGQFRATYRNYAGKTGLRVPDMLGLKLGLMYQF